MSMPNWQREAQAEGIILHFLEKFVRKSPFLSRFEEDLKQETSTYLLAWLDHLVIPSSFPLLQEAGFQEIAKGVFRHPGAQLPDLVLEKDQAGVAIHVESINDFLQVRGLHRQIEGSPFSGFRSCLIEEEKGIHFWVVERRGVKEILPLVTDAEEIARYFFAKELWMTRSRSLENESEDMQEAMRLAKEIAELLGKDAAACLVLECERCYWQAKNTAGQLQKNRQDKLGLGWANHDHHTFRSSRCFFPQLVQLFEELGFTCRERYYTGKEAGWGAQIMENPQAKLVLFLDVDLSPEEIAVDFAHDELPERDRLGTIGLWCALHGDSILKGGMHHLEAQFEFTQLTEDLKKQGIQMMEPFSDFPYLKQAFTAGEMWKVAPERIEHLMKRGLITKEEVEKFTKEGALGSHLENLQRKEGYKGFNQKNVSSIIQKTDPRTMSV